MPKELITFDKALVAVKQGKHVARKGWAANTHYIMGSMDGKKCIGLLMHLNGVNGSASLHNNDLLADDWEITNPPS